MSDSSNCLLISVDLLEERRNQMRAEVGGILLKETKGTCSCGWGKAEVTDTKSYHMSIPLCVCLRFSFRKLLNRYKWLRIIL